MDPLSIILAAGGVIEKVIAFVAARADLADSLRKEVSLEAEKFAKLALQWQVDHPVDVHTPPGDDFKLLTPSSTKASSSSGSPGSSPAESGTSSL